MTEEVRKLLLQLLREDAEVKEALAENFCRKRGPKKKTK